SKASIASCSRSPLVSTVTSLPMPAASIITPMMLLALTRRSPLLTQTSQGKLPASLVSLAEARACRPSLLLIVVVVRIIVSSRLVLRRGDRHLHHALGSADHGPRHQCLQRLVAIAHAAQQHGQVHASDQARFDAVDQLLRHVARRGAENVGEHEHTLDLN